MKSLKRTANRGLAAGIAGALVLGATALVAAPAQAADTAGLLTWNVSETFSNMGFQEQSNGAVRVAGTGYQFPLTGSTIDGDGTITTTFEGSTKAGFVNNGALLYAITVADPKIVLEKDGTGEILATVNSVGSNRDPNVLTPATEVTVAEFSGATTVDGVTSATPNWEGVLPAGSAEATALGLTTAGRPVDGKSFHPEFLGAIHADVRAHFHFTASGDTKRPGTFSYAAAKPTLTASVTGASYADGISIVAKGAGFSAVTNPGDAGVYVALAPANTVINYADRSSLSTMASVDYITPDRFVGDTFTAVLNAPTEKLVKGTEYAIFTWQAHTHSNTTQDTKTAVAIDWSKFEKPVAPKKSSKSTVKVTKKATKKKAGKISISVAGGSTKATGKVKVVIKAPGKKTITKKVTLKRGKASVALTKAKKKGTYKLSVSYSGDKKLKAAKKVTKTFKVKK